MTTMQYSQEHIIDHGWEWKLAIVVLSILLQLRARDDPHTAEGTGLPYAAPKYRYLKVINGVGRWGLLIPV